MLQKIRYFLFLLAVLAMIVVAFQNQNSVDFNILFFKGRYPLTLLLLATSGLSFVLGVAYTMWRGHRRGKASPRVKTRAKKLSAKKSGRGTPFGSDPRNDGVDE